MINKDNGSEVPENKTEKAKPQEMFTKPVRDGIISYIEREVDKFDFDGYEVVRREWFSKANCPAITFKYGSIVLNVRAIRKLDECSHIQFLLNLEKNSMIVKPSEEDNKESVQCSRVDKYGKVVPKTIKGIGFTAKLYQDMKWNIEGTYKMLGTLLINKTTNEKIFEFCMANAEAYLRISKPSADDPKRRVRVQMPEPSHLAGHYGQTYEENQKPIIEIFEGMPDGYVKIVIPKKSNEKTEQDNSTQEIKEKTEDETK